MELSSAENQKTFSAEKRIAYIRAVVILFGAVTFFLLKNPHMNRPLAMGLMAVIWVYGGYVLIAKPYERYPILLASWFTYLGDCIFTTAWVFATGGFYSPYYVIYYASIIAVAFRFGIRTTLATSVLYAVFYLLLMLITGQFTGHETELVVRAGFIVIIGALGNYITLETLYQTKEKLQFKQLMEDAILNRRKLEASAKELSKLNDEMQLHLDLFKHAEQNAEIGSYWWNVNENKMQYSDNLFRLLGEEPGAFTPSFEKYLEFLHPEDQEAAMREVKDSLARGEIRTQIRKLRINGEIRCFRLTGKFTIHAGQRLMIGTLQDITEDIRLSESLDRKNKELQTINSELSSFNYIASHDLQEPVRKIHTFGNLLLDKEKESMSETAGDYLGRIVASAKRMQKLIGAFSNYSRIGHTTTPFAKVDLNVLLYETLEQMKERIEKNKAIVEFNNLPQITASAYHMRLLFENLLGNALKYASPVRPTQITIEMNDEAKTETDATGENKMVEFWCIRVRDNGIGFEQKYAGKIFEVFQRLHSKEEYPGTGIGLAICKKIAELHGGSIAALSEPGKGSTFTVMISKSLKISGSPSNQEPEKRR